MQKWMAYIAPMPEASHPIHRQMKNRISARRGGFTLVELLVVIGIIAMLIGLLLPSVSRAQRIAKRTACMAKLHEMMVGAQLHQQEHRGFYPLVGVIAGLQPQDLGDSDSVRYDYFSFPFPDGSPLFQRMVAPITISLATELSAKEAQFVLSNQSVGNAETDDGGFIKNFLCPAQAVSTSELLQLPMLYSVVAPTKYGMIPVVYTEAQSYVYNEAVMGWADYRMGFNYSRRRLKGQYNQIRQPARSFFAADGLMGSVYDGRFPWAYSGMMTLYNKVGYGPVTMWDAYTSDSNAGDTENFDLHRHDRKINVAFCDCHVETRNINQSDLSTVYLVAP